MARLNGTVAIVTGAAQGIGATYAKALAAEGADLPIYPFAGLSLSHTGNRAAHQRGVDQYRADWGYAWAGLC